MCTCLHILEAWNVKQYITNFIKDSGVLNHIIPYENIEC